MEELVPAGSIDPDDVHTPGIYVDRVVQARYRSRCYKVVIFELVVDSLHAQQQLLRQGERYDKIIERLTVAGESTKGSGLNEVRDTLNLSWSVSVSSMLDVIAAKGILPKQFVLSDCHSTGACPALLTSPSSPCSQIRERIVRRAALELKDGDYVNLGIGLPTLVSNYVPAGVQIKLQSENGWRCRA